MVGDIIFIVALASLITGLIEPLENLKMKLRLYPGQSGNIVHFIITKIFSCAKCFSFWFSLIFGYGITIAIISAVVAEITGRKLLSRY